ncbi:MAG: hypothetical protein ACJ78T_16345 [Myxococcales bacterium]
MSSDTRSVCRFLLVLAVVATPAFAANQELVSVQNRGTASIPTGARAEASGDPALEFDAVADLEGLTQLRDEAALPGPAPAVVPQPVSNPIALANPGFSGFSGITHLDQRNAGTGNFANTQFSLEPPDQGLCVGNGFVLDAVNTAFSIFDTNGKVLQGPVALNQFFHLAPEVIRTPPVRFGDFTSDPRCVFDAATNRWFQILLQLDVDPVTGDFTGPTSLLIATSKTGDPTGDWTISRIDTTNHGTTCPCFGDQPLIGMNRDGFFLSTNAFSLVTGGFVGVQLYAISKAALVNGSANTAVHISDLSTPPGLPFSVQPAVTAQRDGSGNPATEFFANIFDIRQQFQNKLAVWALRGTDTLSAASPRLDLTSTVIETEVFTRAPPATQKQPAGAPSFRLDTGGTRLQQVTFAQGRLWTALTTGVRSPGETTTRAGVAFFIIKAESGGGGVNARIDNQGYVAVANANASYPAVAVNHKGQALIGFALSGPGLFPSTAYTQLDARGNAGAVHVAGIGTAPDDGFTGKDGTGVGRWGDYSFATTDENGAFWVATEFIPDAPRNASANWGTFVTRVVP